MFGGGISTAFLHGDLQLAFAMPKDPTQPIVGQAVMTVKNVSNTGNQLILDLQADPTSLDRAGRPTRFTWTQNPASGGIFTNGSGSGTLQIQYTPGGKRPPRTFASGTAGVLFQGLLYATNLTNTLRNQVISPSAVSGRSWEGSGRGTPRSGRRVPRWAHPYRGPA